MKKTSQLLIGLFAMAAVSSAFAAPFIPHVYVGGNIGQTDYSDVGGHSTSGKAYVGYQFTPYVGVEAQYTDLGRTSGVKSAGGGVDLVGTAPLGNNFSLIGKAGVTRMNTENDNAAGSPSVNRTGAHYGVGAAYALNQNASVLAEVERYNRLGDASTGVDTKANVASVGVRYDF